MRFILQPTVAIILGAHDGVKDARAGNPPFLWGLMFRSSHLTWAHAQRFGVGPQPGRDCDPFGRHLATSDLPYSASRCRLGTWTDADSLALLHIARTDEPHRAMAQQTRLYC